MRTNLLMDLQASILVRLPLTVYCQVINMRNRIRGKAHRISPFEGNHILKAYDATDEIFLCRRRLHNRYRHGIQARIDKLAKEYHLDHVPTKRGGLLIDCGANIGELGLWALARGMDYVAFEPEPLEARCIDLNVYGGEPKATRKALWNSNSSIEFFSKPESEDSSIIEMDGAQSQMIIEAVRLDTAIALNGRTGPVIFKVEGEGAEPEILEGATGVLPLIDFVTVDCGFERGREQSPTFVESNALLVDAGFRLQEFEFGRVTALYHNANR